ncbi:peptidylprolyl isomerase [Paenibacillus solisilvae]|uniref:Foldase protein PrsA n=1 Tax=Paenibacillus solisilvae TaxID=2486751 RepID=A0ABW0VT31_9BACL
MNEKENEINKETELEKLETGADEGVHSEETPDETVVDRTYDPNEEEEDDDTVARSADKDNTNRPPEAAAPVKGGSKSWMYISMGLAILLVIALIKPPFGGSSSETVATVNGVAISKDKLFDSMAELGGAQTLDNLIQDELITQEADKAGIKVTDADVDKEIESVKGRFPSEAEFEAALQQAGMTLEDLKKQTPMQLRIRKILEPQVVDKVTEADMKTYFDENKASFNTPLQVRASHILVATEKEANDILKELKAGGDFAAIAKAKSTDTGSKESGGDLGFFGAGAMDPAFEKAAFALKKDELSAPVKSTYGYHIIKVTDRKEAKTATYDEEKSKIKDLLISQKVSELSQTWLADLKTKSKITNTLEDKAAAETPAEGNAAAPANAG